MSDYIIDLNSENFDSTIDTNSLVLVDLWATWCGPCQILLPVIDDLGEHYQNSVIISKLEVDSNSDLALKLGVRSVPTLILFKNGNEVDRISGVRSKSELTRWIDKFKDSQLDYIS